MARNFWMPSIEQRLEGLMEVTRRNLKEHGFCDEARTRPTVTLTREFGCEGYPVAEKLQDLLQARSGVPWVVMDRALLEAVAKDHDVNEGILENLGSKNRFIDDMISTFSPHWKSEKDYYRLLCRQITALALKGNVILVGRGAAILTQQVGNCYHFRIVAPMDFKVKSVAARMDLSADQAQDLIRDRQRQRDNFLKDFLGRDVADPTLYHLVFNNARFTADAIARFMAEVVLPEKTDQPVASPVA